MITSILGSLYGMTIAKAVYHTAHIKQLYDIDAESKGLREIDLSYEKPNGLPVKNCMVMGKVMDKKQLYKILTPKLLEQQQQTNNPQTTTPQQQNFIFKQYLGYHPNLQPPKIFKFPFKFQKFSFYLFGQSNTTTTLTSEQRINQVVQVNIQGAVNTQFFDLQMIAPNTNIFYSTSKNTLSNKYLSRYLINPFKYLLFNLVLRKQFGHKQVGIRNGNQIIVVGDLEQSRRLPLFKNEEVYNNVKFYKLNNPKIVIGSDKRELSQFIKIQSELNKAKCLKLIKVCVLITAAHFCLVKIPLFFFRETEF